MDFLGEGDHLCKKKISILAKTILSIAVSKIQVLMKNEWETKKKASLVGKLENPFLTHHLIVHTTL